MPHRPADSRLLSNLLAHEKDYVRSLLSELDYGQASLASFSAYAAASPPPASRAIGSVVTALVGAQEALRGYVSAVEEWCEQLKLLKVMEDEVGNIGRDREILVDRLIKASKANNPKRRSLLPSSSSNQSLPVRSSSSGHAVDQLAFSNSKLNLAQNELQACETHLTEKERMLAKMRESCVVGGLKMRCRALAECGLKWSEVGRIGLQALDNLNTMGSFDQTISMQKPLPEINYPYQRPSSDLSSSLSPSQSASQIFHPNATSENYHPSTSSSSGAVARGPAPEADIRDECRFELSIPPAHAISEEDHYTPPQARIQERVAEEEDAGGSSLEEDANEPQYEVHENPLFSHPLAKGKVKQGGSRTRLPLKHMKRLNSASATNLPASASAPLPSPHKSPSWTKRHIDDPFGTSSSGKAYSDGQQSTPRTRKRSTFLGALSNIFHKRNATEPAEDSGALSSSPKKEKWHTRTDKYLKKAGKGDDSSDEETSPLPTQANSAPSTKPRTPLSEPRSRPLEKETNIDRSSPKRAPSAGKKLRKASDASGHRRISSSGLEDAQAPPPQVNGAKAGAPSSKEAVVSPSVSRSSTVLTKSTTKSGSSARPASLDLHPKAKRQVTLSDAGHNPPVHKQRRRTSSPPTHGQTSLLSIVEDVTRQNRQGWQQANPNNLLFEVKAPMSIYHTLNLDESVSASANHPRASSDLAGGIVESRRKESPLRNPLLEDYKRNGLFASGSEPSLPLKRLPPTPSSAAKAPLRSALRNRSGTPSPATSTPPRTTSPCQPANGGHNSALGHPPAGINSAGISVKDDDTASLASVYETGREDSDSDPPTPTVLPKPNGQGQHQQQEQSLPNGHSAEVKSDGSNASASDTAGTGTPPSRRKSVRVSLKPTFSPTPPASADYEEDRTPWAPEPPVKQVGGSHGTHNSGGGWGSSRRTGNATLEDSSDDDEEYLRAKEMLFNASRKLETMYKG